MSLMFFPKERLTAGVLFVALFLSLCLPIEEPDFFWHLGQGLWILDHLRLPEFDVFSYPSVMPDSRDLFVLKGYWLAQILYATLWKAAGAVGVVIVQAVTLTGILAVIYFYLRRAGLSIWGAFACVLPVFFDLRLLFINGTRPQLYSFFFAALLVYILDSDTFRDRVAHYLLLFGALVFWVNLHPGALFGFLVLTLYAFSSIVDAVQKKCSYARGAGYLFASTGIFFSANGWLVLKPLLLPLDKTRESAFYYSGHADGMTLLQVWDIGVFGFWGGVSAAAFSAVVLLYCRFRVRREHILLFLLLVVLSAFMARFFVFMTIVSMMIIPPYATHSLRHVIDVHSALRKIFPYAVCLAVAACAFYIHLLQGSGLKTPVNHDRYPGQAIRFIRNFMPQGNLLNPYEWGGYLMVYLPEYKVFVDGRGMQVNQGKMIDFEMLRTGFSLRPNDSTLWKKTMERYDIRIVLSHREDSRFPLNRILLGSPHWYLAYQDEVARVFLKK